MLKPLELKVFPKHIWRAGLASMPVYDWNGIRLSERNANLASHNKRLTEPELAAEYESARCDLMLMQHADFYWAPLGDTWPSDPEAIDRRAETLLRFATLPHYDEEATP